MIDADILSHIITNLVSNAVKYSPIPLHPGTIRYLKEKGIAVPAGLTP